MTDPRFFASVGPLTLGELAERTGAEIAAGGDRDLPMPLRPGIAASAIVDPTVCLGDGCKIAANVVIGAETTIGRDSRIDANSVIGDRGVVGEAAPIGANVSLSHCLIGDRVRILPGARIGQEGFGVAPDPGGDIRVPQFGRVVIGDDVEIGANATIDRGAGPDTVIGDGTMIDNLVQIGHNVVIGRWLASRTAPARRFRHDRRARRLGPSPDAGQGSTSGGA
jgi:UDP-3-O-[3-hydroxymyristoyl] glucosamine N-acyltransferase LpxD